MIEWLPYIIAGVLAVAGAFGIRQSGKNAARNEQQADERKAIDKAKEVQNEVSSMADDDINRRLTSWLRGGKR